MANTLRLEIVTPEATAYSEDVDMVTLPGVEGQMGVLPLHVRLMTQDCLRPRQFRTNNRWTRRSLRHEQPPRTA